MSGGLPGLSVPLLTARGLAEVNPINLGNAMLNERVLIIRDNT